MTEQVREVISGVRLIKTYALAGSRGERRLEVTAARGYLKQNLSLARVMAPILSP